jgi:hypothetical protein
LAGRHGTFLPDAFDVLDGILIASEAHMLCSIKLAPLAIIGAFATIPTPARAQAPIDLAYTPAQVGSVVGGGGASLSGGGDDMAITQSSSGAGGGSALAQVPRLAQGVNGTTGGLSVQYLEPERAPAGREAWLLGGGDDAQVTYLNPAGARRR